METEKAQDVVQTHPNVKPVLKDLVAFKVTL